MDFDFVGPPDPIDYRPREFYGRAEDPKRNFMKDMSPMLTAQLADLISTEAVRLGGGSESNPLIRELQVGGSNAPVMAVGSLLQAYLFHKLGKKHPNIASALKTIQTAGPGTAAGQNFALIGKQRPYRDERLSVWLNK